MASFIPIIGVGAKGAEDSALSPLPKQPSQIKFGLYDVSDENAGRTADGAMQANKLGSCVKIEMSWNVLNSVTAQSLFSLFSSEYFDVRFYNPYTGQIDRKEFYCGDRSAPLYNSTLDIWKDVAFNIIQRTPD